MSDVFFCALNSLRYSSFGSQVLLAGMVEMRRGNHNVTNQIYSFCDDWMRAGMFDVWNSPGETMFNPLRSQAAPLVIWWDETTAIMMRWLVCMLLIRLPLIMCVDDSVCKYAVQEWGLNFWSHKYFKLTQVFKDHLLDKCLCLLLPL